VRARSVSPPRKRVVHTASIAAARLGRRERMQPAFLIVGAQRCGTTSMYRALSYHPAILKPALHKGVHYFDINYGQPMSWYRAHFPAAAQARRVERATGCTAMTYESSPFYLFHPLAGERIARDLPGVKLLVLVRDPVERAYSAHAHELARGYETEPFERAVELEPQRLSGEAERMTSDPDYVSFSLQHHAYLTRGQYTDQLDRLEALFGAERIHVVDSGDFFGVPEQTYNGVLRFLGLPALGHPTFERHNGRPRLPLDSELQTALSRHFEPYDRRLGRWLGGPPSWRRQD
jgi:sulfotransferase family protein